ncbi:MAG: GTP cyclohydrolase II [Pseudomonadota bacterium]
MFSQVIDLPTEFGTFKSFALKDGHHEHLVIYKGEIENKECLVRIHSECLTGDLFHSKRCDCGDQFNQAIKLIAENNGILIYLRQEGRGIGLYHKLNAYSLQDEGLDTVDANIELGLPVDNRDYKIVIEILKKLKPKKIKLLTNNPRKLDSLKDYIEVTRIPLHTSLKDLNKNYIKTKEEKLYHWKKDDL